ncbi:MAG TPA: VapE domain-containing protein [Terriglobia bacterium]|nr:VapE domain-containing protein [Terriglobia bacterium]
MRVSPRRRSGCCLILEGPLGIRKSTALRTLAGEFFTDDWQTVEAKMPQCRPAAFGSSSFPN